MDGGGGQRSPLMNLNGNHPDALSIQFTLLAPADETSAKKRGGSSENDLALDNECFIVVVDVIKAFLFSPLLSPLPPAPPPAPPPPLNSVSLHVVVFSFEDASFFSNVTDETISTISFLIRPLSHERTMIAFIFNQLWGPSTFLRVFPMLFNSNLRVN